MYNAPNPAPEILVFRTSLHLEQDVNEVAALMNSEERIQRWNVDLHDVDKVLRIETACLPADDVIQLLRQAGYHCEELDD